MYDLRFLFKILAFLLDYKENQWTFHSKTPNSFPVKVQSVIRNFATLGSNCVPPALVRSCSLESSFRGGVISAFISSKGKNCCASRLPPNRSKRRRKTIYFSFLTSLFTRNEALFACHPPSRKNKFMWIKLFLGSRTIKNYSCGYNRNNTLKVLCCPAKRFQHIDG